MLKGELAKYLYFDICYPKTSIKVIFWAPIWKLWPTSVHATKIFKPLPLNILSEKAYYATLISDISIERYSVIETYPDPNPAL